MHSYLYTLVYVIIGVGAGVLSAVFGVGGAALSTPSIRVMGVSALYAIGTTLPSVLPGVITGMYGYRGRKLIRFDIVAIVAPTGILASILGSIYSHKIPGNGHILMIVTAIILFANASRLAFSKRKTRDKERISESDIDIGIVKWRDPIDVDTKKTQTKSFSTSSGVGNLSTAVRTGFDLRSISVLSSTGLLAGLISGMLGLGGGIVLVPLFVNRLRLPLLQATATSLVCIGVLAIPSIITHSLIGDINWPIAAYLTLGTIPGARIGAHLALRLSESWLRLVAALVLSAIALVYGVSETIALFR